MTRARASEHKHATATPNVAHHRFEIVRIHFTPQSIDVLAEIVVDCSTYFLICHNRSFFGPDHQPDASNIFASGHQRKGSSLSRASGQPVMTIFPVSAD